MITCVSTTQLRNSLTANAEACLDREGCIYDLHEHKQYQLKTILYVLTIYYYINNQDNLSRKIAKQHAFNSSLPSTNFILLYYF